MTAIERVRDYYENHRITFSILVSCRARPASTAQIRQDMIYGTELKDYNFTERVKNLAKKGVLKEVEPATRFNQFSRFIAADDIAHAVDAVLNEVIK